MEIGTKWIRAQDRISDFHMRERERKQESEREDVTERNKIFWIVPISKDNSRLIYECRKLFQISSDSIIKKNVPEFIWNVDAYPLCSPFPEIPHHLRRLTAPASRCAWDRWLVFCSGGLGAPFFSDSFFWLSLDTSFFKALWDLGVKES